MSSTSRVLGMGYISVQRGRVWKQKGHGTVLRTVMMHFDAVLMEY